MSPVLILRPLPGGEETAARARAMGLEAIVAPLFEIRPLAWQPPDPGSFDAILLTSATGARNAGQASPKPCYAVGPATAEAARQACFADIRTGPSDGEAAVAMMVADGVARALHLCGRDHLQVDHPGLSLQRVVVYAAEPASALPDAAIDALRRRSVVLLHSPRAAATFAALVEDRAPVRIAAISAAAAERAGEGWAAKKVAAEPRDEALLEVAASLCNIGAPGQA